MAFPPNLRKSQISQFFFPTNRKNHNNNRTTTKPNFAICAQEPPTHEHAMDGDDAAAAVARMAAKPALKKKLPLHNGQGDVKKKKALKWDEVAIEEHDQLRGTRMKVRHEPTGSFVRSKRWMGDCGNSSMWDQHHRGWLCLLVVHCRSGALLMLLLLLLGYFCVLLHLFEMA